MAWHPTGICYADDGVFAEVVRPVPSCAAAAVAVAAIAPAAADVCMQHGLVYLPDPFMDSRAPRLAHVLEDDPS